MSGKAIVLWMTGMSGSGKSTIAGILSESLRSNGMKPLSLDGDHVRERLHTHLSFTREDILENNRLVAKLCAESLFDYDAILVPIISPYAKGRRRAREIVGDSFFEIYIRTPLEELVRRDTKGLYGKALNGEIDNLIGFSQKLPYQEPQNPDLVLLTDHATPEECACELEKNLQQWINNR